MLPAAILVVLAWPPASAGVPCCRLGDPCFPPRAGFAGLRAGVLWGDSVGFGAVGGSAQSRLPSSSSASNSGTSSPITFSISRLFVVDSSSQRAHWRRRSGLMN